MGFRGAPAHDERTARQMIGRKRNSIEHRAAVILRTLGDGALRKKATALMTDVVELVKESRRAYERADEAERRGERARGAAFLAGANAIRVAAAARKAAQKN